MDWLRRLLRPRRHPRHYTTKGVFVIVSPYPYKPEKMEGRKLQILDISEGGCAFIYNGTKQDLVEAGILCLMDEDSICLESADFVTVTDKSLPQEKEEAGWIRRRGVMFKWLGVFDRKRLKEFIKQKSIGRAS